MRNFLCIVFFLLCGRPIQAQPEAPLFDGKATSGWVIEGDAEVKDGVLVLGGNQKTRVRIAANFSSNFELHLEYSAENNQPIQFESHFRHLLSRGMVGSSLYRTPGKPGEWIEAIYWGKEHPAGNGWRTMCKWRVVGEPAFTEHEVGGSSSVPRSVFVAFEIPVGQKLYLRNVRVKPDPLASFPWLLVSIAGALVGVLVIAVAASAIVRKRRAPTQAQVRPEKGTS